MKGNKKTPNVQRPTSNVEVQKELPVVVDPYSRSGDEVAGGGANEIALNLWMCVSISRRHRQALHRPPPNLLKLFRGHDLSAEARAALRKTEAVFASVTFVPSV